MFTCNEEKQVVEGPHHPFFPSFLPTLVTAPLLQPAAAQPPGLLSAINIPSLAGGNLSPNLCRLSLLPEDGMDPVAFLLC